MSLGRKKHNLGKIERHIDKIHSFNSVKNAAEQRLCAKFKRIALRSRIAYEKNQKLILCKTRLFPILSKLAFKTGTNDLHAICAPRSAAK